PEPYTNCFLKSIDRSMAVDPRSRWQLASEWKKSLEREGNFDQPAYNQPLPPPMLRSDTSSPTRTPVTGPVNLFKSPPSSLSDSSSQTSIRAAGPVKLYKPPPPEQSHLPIQNPRQKGGLTDIKQVPWRRRSSTNLIVLMVFALLYGIGIIGMAAVCANALCNDIYCNKKDEAGFLKQWGIVEKIVIFAILTVYAFFFHLNFYEQ
ncbi:MAG: hypothetical protein KC931_22460, partial [Candidatus Omnitrophica bacterium]|nr:hypothetical protein [Candidatus Omnitrophota bacterium]